MKKPEKKEIREGNFGFNDEIWNYGNRHYNQAIDEYEKFLPSEGEIMAIIVSKAPRCKVNNKEGKQIGDMQLLHDFEGLAKAISKRIGR